VRTTTASATTAGTAKTSATPRPSLQRHVKLLLAAVAIAVAGMSASAAVVPPSSAFAADMDWCTNC
jgi:hypothetical protein